jgi:hypothetical protein
VYERYASSALAAQSFLRNTFAACFPLFSQQMYEKLTPKYASTLLAAIACVLGVVPFVLIKYGDRIRSHSRAALALQREEQEAAEWRQAEQGKQARREARRLARAARQAQVGSTEVDEEKILDTTDGEESGAVTPDAKVGASQDCDNCNNPNFRPPTSIL